MLDSYLINEYVNAVCCNIKNKKIRTEIGEKLKKDIVELTQKYIPYVENEDIAIKKAIRHFGDPVMYADLINKNYRQNSIFNIFNLCFF